jgi:hypothetical protein
MRCAATASTAVAARAEAAATRAFSWARLVNCSENSISDCRSKRRWSALSASSMEPVTSAATVDGASTFFDAHLRVQSMQIPQQPPSSFGLMPPSSVTLLQEESAAHALRQAEVVPPAVQRQRAQHHDIVEALEADTSCACPKASRILASCSVPFCAGRRDYRRSEI